MGEWQLLHWTSCSHRLSEGRTVSQEAVWAIFLLPCPTSSTPPCLGYERPSQPCGAMGVGVPRVPHPTGTHPWPHPFREDELVSSHHADWQQFQHSSVILGLVMHGKGVSWEWFNKNVSWLVCIPLSWGKVVEFFCIKNRIAPPFLELTFTLKSAGDPFAQHVTVLFCRSPVTKLHPDNYLGIQQCNIRNGRPELENVCCLCSYGIFFFNTYILSFNCL